MRSLRRHWGAVAVAPSIVMSFRLPLVPPIEVDDMGGSNGRSNRTLPLNVTPAVRPIGRNGCHRTAADPPRVWRTVPARRISVEAAESRAHCHRLFGGADFQRDADVESRHVTSTARMDFLNPAEEAPTW